MWKYRPHQVEGANWTLQTLRNYGLAYLSMQERTGKTGTAILACENSKATRILVVTKKKAIDGWIEAIAMFPTKKDYEIINYESVHKVPKDNYDLIILDEAHHAISSTGRPSATWKKVYPFTRGKAIIYLSATPYAEHLGLIYHQLKLSDWTPFKERNFYEWFKVYGKSNLTRTPYGLVEQYNKYDDNRILALLKPLFYFKTRTDVGIKHEPTVKVIKVALEQYTLDLMKELVNHSVIEVGDKQVVCDSPMKQRMVHYQLEGGTIKHEDGAIYLPTREKATYLLHNYEGLKVAVMAHFIAERDMLTWMLHDNFTVFSSDGDAEGVSLAMYDKLVVYSMSEKTSKFTQRLARQANHERDEPIEVDILVADKPAIGLAIYESVALKKENFNKNSYDLFTKGM